jgi:hypothetical protein
LVIYLSTGAIAAPIVMADRVSVISATVMFTVPASERTADHFEIRVYASTGPSNVDTDILVSHFP